MVVEDEPDIARLVELQLAQHGYRVIIAKPGQMSLLDPDFWTWVDVAVVDAMMPFISGKQVLQFLATNLPDIRRVLCTASIPLARELGEFAHALVTKPFSAQELINAVEGIGQ